MSKWGNFKQEVYNHMFLSTVCSGTSATSLRVISLMFRLFELLQSDQNVNEDMFEALCHRQMLKYNFKFNIKDSMI
jgi:hypothetical protein